MKIPIFILLAFSSLFVACEKYETNKGKVHTYRWESGSRIKVEIAGADPGTFKVLSDKDYAKDRKNVYYQGERIAGADSSSFQIIEKVGDPYWRYAKDRKRVYSGGRALDGANPASFDILDPDSRYSKDSTLVFYCSKLIAGADAPSFRALQQLGWAVDHEDAYFEGQRLNVADIASFEVMPPAYRKQEYDSMLKSLGRERIPCEWAKDSQAYYCLYNRIPISDYNSFEVLTDGYAKDKNHVYYEHKIIEGADSITFRMFEYAIKVNSTKYYESIGVDKKFIYRDGKQTLPNKKWMKEIGLEIPIVSPSEAIK